MISLITTIFDLVKSGKSTIDEVMKDPKINAEMDNLTRVIEAEQQHGDSFTKRARPTAIYMCIFIMFNDFVLVDYINMFFDFGTKTIINDQGNAIEITKELPHLLTDEKYKLMIGFLTALGLARSVMDKQGNWLQQLFTKKK